MFHTNVRIEAQRPEECRFLDKLLLLEIKVISQGSLYSRVLTAVVNLPQAYCSSLDLDKSDAMEQ